MKVPERRSSSSVCLSRVSTTTIGQRQMELELYRQLMAPQSLALGDAIKIAKAASSDFDVRTTWIFFGDPSIKIR